MRVEIRTETDETGKKFEIPWQDPATETGFLDLRAQASAVELIGAAREHRSLAGFLAAVNSSDSLFLTARAKVWLEDGPASDEPYLFTGRIVLAFAEMAANLERSGFTHVLERLQELLAGTEASEALRACLTLHLCRYAEVAQWGFCVSLLVQASGSTKEQAGLRWALGLAHVQQALLFSSRVLRQERARRS